MFVVVGSDAVSDVVLVLLTDIVVGVFVVVETVEDSGKVVDVDVAGESDVDVVLDDEVEVVFVLVVVESVEEDFATVVVDVSMAVESVVDVVLDDTVEVVFVFVVVEGVEEDFATVVVDVSVAVESVVDVVLVVINKESRIMEQSNKASIPSDDKCHI